MNEYKKDLYELLYEIGLLGPIAGKAFESLQKFLDNDDLLIINKKCLPLYFDKQKAFVFGFNSEHMMEYSLKLDLTSKCISKILDTEEEKYIKDKLVQDMYYYLESLDSPKDVGNGFQVINKEYYFKK